MFKARLKKYWCDYLSDYIDIRTNSIEEILEYVYSIHKNSPYPAVSSFICSGGTGKFLAYLEANCSLPEKMGYRGSVWLEKITYYKGDGSDEVIIFSKYDRYISPKASKAFNDFAEIAKQRDENKNFGDY